MSNDGAGQLSPRRPERLGLFGGTFDPPHAGHLAAARAALEQLDLDRLLLVVANDPWQKTPSRHISPAPDRVAMVAAACDGVPGLEVSDIEIKRGGPSYTVETVESLRAEARAGGRADPEIFLVVGSDLVPTLPTWRRVDDLRAAVTLAVVTRPHSPVVLPERWRTVVVGGDEVDVSSSEVRHRLEQGQSLEGLVPDPVIRCIAARDLYAVAR